MTRAGLVAALLVAFVAGGFLWGQVRVAWERCRRVLFEWKKGRRGQRTLRKMGRRHAGQLVQAVGLLLLAVAVAVFLIVRSTS